MDAYTRLKIAYSYFGTCWVDLRELQRRYWFLKSMEGR
jgi:hypothetical protein